MCLALPALAAVAAVPGCHSGRRPLPPDAAPGAPRCVRFPLDTTPRRFIADRYEDVFPTPAQRTTRDLLVLHGVLARFLEERGRLPDSLSQVLELGPPPEVPIESFRPRAEWLIDGWGRTVRYAAGSGAYVLGSAGTDGLDGTADDIASAGPCAGAGHGIRLGEPLPPGPPRR